VRAHMGQHEGILVHAWRYVPAGPLVVIAIECLLRCRLRLAFESPNHLAPNKASRKSGIEQLCGCSGDQTSSNRPDWRFGLGTISLCRDGQTFCSN